MAVANTVYGRDFSVDNVVLHRAVILDDTCDPILRTTLNEDDGTLEFASFTATADGEPKWAITATAELNVLPPAPSSLAAADSAEPVVSISGDDFYRRTESIGFDYGDAFRTVRKVTAGRTGPSPISRYPTRSPMRCRASGSIRSSSTGRCRRYSARRSSARKRTRIHSCRPEFGTGPCTARPRRR